MIKFYLIFTIVIFGLFSCSSSKINPVNSILLFKSDPPKKGINAYPTALGHGYLVLRGNCLYLKPNKNNNEGLFGIIWPWDYSLNIVENNVIVVNSNQKHIAKVGEYIKLGGAGTSRVALINKYRACNSFTVKSVFVGNPEL